MLLTSACCASAIAQNSAAIPPILITNTRIFYGQNEKFADEVRVLVEGNKIVKIAKSITAPTGATGIHAKGKVSGQGQAV